MAQEFTYDVFLSHSSQDKPAVRALAEKLRDDELRVWFDEWCIEPGARIDLAIENGLQISRRLVLMMSHHAFGSDWVGLERGAALYRDPANTERRFLTVRLDDCEIPDLLRPYAYIDYRNRSEEAYTKLLNACKPQHRPGTPRPAKGLDGRFELTVQLSVHGNQLHRAFYNHQRTFLDDFPSSWTSLATTLNLWHTHPEMCQISSDFTKTLWDTLFGPDDTKILALLNQLTGSDLKTPIYEPLRIRIYTQDPVLAALPWALTTWQGERLIKQAWTFELTATPPQDNTPRYGVDLPSPFPVLLLAPAGDRNALEWDMHQRDVEQKFRDLWRVTNGFLHTVSQRAELTKWRQQTVGLLYYYGPAQIDQGKLAIAFSTGRRQPIDALIQEWGAGRVQAVFLNLVQEDTLPLGTTLAALSARVPLVIAQTTKPAACRHAQQTFLAWLDDTLGGADPLQALHTRGHASAVAWRNMAHWHVDPRGRDRIPIERLAYLLLDRTDERALVNRAVDDMVDRDKRLTCIVAYADESNHPELFFPEQAREYLRTHARDKVSVELYPLQFPTNPLAAHALEMALCRAFGIAAQDATTGLKRALENLRDTRFAGKLRGNARPLLVLDWKVWKITTRSRIQEALEAWARLHQRYIFSACPTNLHILAGLALESAAARHAEIQHVVDNLRRDRALLQTRAFTLEKTAHLRHVSHEDLEDFFLRHQEELQCSQDLCFNLADVIYRQTNGQYDAICTYIAQRQNASWETLYDRWQRNG